MLDTLTPPVDLRYVGTVLLLLVVAAVAVIALDKWWG